MYIRIKEKSTRKCNNTYSTRTKQTNCRKYAINEFAKIEKNTLGYVCTARGKRNLPWVTVYTVQYTHNYVEQKSRD
jgi:hypothetical protein